MKTVVDLRQLLKQYGSFIYTRDRKLDLQLMLEEVKELYQYGMISIEEYQKAVLVIRHEEQLIQ
ncbi:uncharacterized protein YqgQ [Alkalihalobacillus xiaoxiensis]|uniref:Uncharacterized protein YqgQ n=1 Tax=Shouchella xiaoxiensis TaxID=766895 RepID=A0ABS2SUK0_9BACI|nr:YqgQ family protein [Shouchella xiaoxiensis]MBM7838149.1 uncharacterized protein YqgQ [Shouchella xiaoxiensis]